MTRAARAFLLVVSASLGAQEEEPPRFQPNTALLRECRDKDLLLIRAPQLAAQGKFVEALALFEEASEKQPNSVVPLDKTRGVGVWEYVRDQIESWPEEGKAVYRRRADPLAEHAFQGAKRSRDVEALERLIEQFPFSSGVDDALALIGNLRLDAGEDDRAAEAFSRLLAREGAGDRAALTARLGLALSRLGRKSEVEALAAKAAREMPEARVRAGGADRPLAEHLRELAAGAGAGRSAPSLALPAWEMIGGDPSGARIAEPGVELSRLAWGEVIGLPRLDADDEFGLRRGMALVPTSEFRPLFPVVSDGILYVHNGIAVSAYNLFARQPERLWQYRVPSPGSEVMFDNRAIYAPAVQDGRVYANLIATVGGAEDQLGYVRVKFPFPRRALFALDAWSGKVLWRLGGELWRAGDDARRDTLESLASFATGPTPEGGRLYVGAIRQKLSTDVFEHYVLCLEAATGRILWSTFVASGGTEINLFGNSTRESMGSPVTVTRDSVFYATNHGAIAALEKKTGRIRWTYRYRQLPVMPTRSVYVTKNRLEWVNSPPVASGDVVAVTPTDSAFVYAFDQSTGRPLWERPRGRDVRVLYGAKGDLLVLGGDRLEFCDLRTGQLAAPPSGKELSGTGRGAVAPDGVYVPCRDMLRKVNWDGSWDETTSRRWPGGAAEGGNLLVVDGAVVLASQDAIQVFFDRRDQEQSIREALARDPDDPALLYRGALRFLQSGDADAAALLLARSAEITGGSSRPEDERLHRAARKRLYTVSMEQGRGELEAGRQDAAWERFQAARGWAADVPARIEATLYLARIHLVKREDAQAVGEYQRLLLEFGDETLEGTRIFDLARNAINAVLTAAGRAPYAAHEAAAGALLAQARQAGTAEALLKVFRLYPNSAAAEEALFGIVSVYARLGRGDEELAALRRFLREFSGSARAPEAAAVLVRALEAKGHVDSAGALLRRMIREFPDAEVPDGERKVRARDFAEGRLRNEIYARAPGAPPVARLSPPLKKVLEFTEKEFPEGVPLRPGGTPPPGTEDFVLMHYASAAGAAVKAIDAGTGREAWQYRLPSQVRFASFFEESLLVADENRVARLDPRTGAVEWQHVARARMPRFALAGSFLLFLTEEGEPQIVALDALRGTVAWSQDYSGVGPSALHPVGEAVVFTVAAPSRIYLLELETGKWLLQSGPPGIQASQVIHAAEDVLVLHQEGRSLEAYDLPAGTLRWRVALDRVMTRGVEVGPGGLVFMGTRRPVGAGEETLFLMTVSLRTGKIVRRVESPALGDPRFLILDGEQGFVVSREPDRSIAVREISLDDFSIRWTAALGQPEATLLPPVAAKDHLVVGTFEGNAEGKYAYGATLLAKTGGIVQNIKSGFSYDRPPGYGVANGGLIFSVDSKVEVHR